MTRRDPIQRRRRGRRLALAAALACAGLPLVASPTGATPSPAASRAAAGSGLEDRQPAVGPAPAGTPTPTEDGVAAAATAEPPVLVREVDLPAFSLIGLTLDTPSAAQVRVRSGGTWTAWRELHFGEDHGPDGSAEPSRAGAHSEPIWVGAADGYEIVLPAGTGQPTVHLEHGAAEVGTAGLETPGVTSAFALSPGVRSRTSWGARPPTSAPVEASAGLRLAFVHHSVTTNDYSQADVPGILRGIQDYHMDANGWSDIGYNFAVDRFGGIWEAHSGGIVRSIIGAQAAGFNTSSVGVVMLGDFTSAPPTAAQLSAVAEIIAWRFAVAGVDPTQPVTYTTSTGSSKFEPGATVTLDPVSGHRDVGLTACPGGLAYDQLATIRTAVRQRVPGYRGRVPSRFLNSPTRRLTDLQGESPDQVDITSTGTGRLEAAVRGIDGRLYTTRWDGTRWVGWQAVDGILRYAPAVVGSPSGALDAFVIGQDGALYQRSRATPTGPWTSWRSLGGQLTSAPDAVRAADGTVLVGARGLDGGIWVRLRNPAGTWSGWTTMGGGTPAGSAPAFAVTTGLVPTTNVLVRGLDDALWVRTSNLLGAFDPWRRVGGVLTTGPAAAGGAAGDALDVVVRGSDGRVYGTRGYGSSFSAFGPLTKEPVAVAPALASWGTGRLDLVASTLDGRVFQGYWTPSAGW